jgi:creatinine amidohydrolase/Fe(II)-dependent formamide hydrolase-like protein
MVCPKILRLLTFIVASLSTASVAHAQNQSVFIEDLTWPELQARVAAGATTALIPTGGTEASGPHLVLGKHNFIVRETAARIAATLGTALVAPVVAVVPEGRPEQSAGNFAFPGTLGISDETFAAILRDEATSLAASGFKLIGFVGDHGQSQSVQAQVAMELTKLWRARGVRVLNVDAYYNPARDDHTAEEAGIPSSALGDHAGIADTAALMATRPDAVRLALRAPEAWQHPGPSGASGRPDLATDAVGNRLLKRRIDAAVAELRN